MEVGVGATGGVVEVPLGEPGAGAVPSCWTAAAWRSAYGSSKAIVTAANPPAAELDDHD